MLNTKTTKFQSRHRCRDFTIDIHYQLCLYPTSSYLNSQIIYTFSVICPCTRMSLCILHHHLQYSLLKQNLVTLFTNLFKLNYFIDNIIDNWLCYLLLPKVKALRRTEITCHDFITHNAPKRFSSQAEIFLLDFRIIPETLKTTFLESNELSETP